MEQLDADVINIIGDSPQMQSVIKDVRKVAASDAPVVILGEKGTGKRLLARTIHHLGKRVNHPFIVVNCDSIPKDLVEVEFLDMKKVHSQVLMRKRRVVLSVLTGAPFF